jgi:hypothetical protein
MSINQSVARINGSVAEVLDRHVVLTVESLDRMSLSAIVPRLQLEKNVAAFFLRHRQVFFVKELARMTRDFGTRVERFAEAGSIPLIAFETKARQRKEDVAAEHRRQNPIRDGVLFIGKAQEKAFIPRVTKTKSNTTGRTIPWLTKRTAMVNHYYFYCVDDDFGPFFIKYCSYFPYNARLCLNGHEYCKRQLEKEGIEYRPLENGVLSCANPQRLQEICDGLTADKIRALWNKWQARLPQPFTDDDRRAGFGYEVFMQQVEFSRTQVFDRPLSGRLFFEQMLRDNLDLGRPDKLQLVFDKQIPRTTKTQFRTRLITEHVIPSLWLDYKSSSIKQYFKEGRALRTELTVNTPRDFGFGKALHNLAALRQVAFAANRRLLHVQQLSHDPTLGDDEFRTLTTPQVIDGQRVSGLRFGDTTVLAVLTALMMFRNLPQGFTNSQLRHTTARLLTRSAPDLKPGLMTYHLRRLRLRGLITRLPRTHRYQVTDHGHRATRFYITSLSRVIRPTANDLDNPQLLNRFAKAIAPTKT